MFYSTCLWSQCYKPFKVNLRTYFYKVISVQDKKWNSRSYSKNVLDKCLQEFISLILFGVNIHHIRISWTVSKYWGFVYDKISKSLKKEVSRLNCQNGWILEVRQQFIKATINWSGNSLKTQFTKMAIHWSGNSSKWQFIEVAFHWSSKL